MIISIKVKRAIPFMLAVVLVIGTSTSWAAITNCGSGNPGNETCIASGNDKLANVQTLLTAHLNSGTTLDSLTLLTKSDDELPDAPNFSGFGELMFLTFKDPGPNKEPIGGTWKLFSNSVDFISIKAAGGFKVYDVMSTMTGSWDTVGIGDFASPGTCEICELSHISFWQSTSTPVPIPGAALLFGSGLLGLMGIVNRKTRGTQN